MAMSATAVNNKKTKSQLTEEQILDAAIACVKRWGIERVTLNDIADEARVARSTVYNYYSNRDEVIRAALLQSAYGFGAKLVEYIMQFQTAEERLIEAVLFGLRILPDEPSLVLLSDSSLSQMVKEHSLTTPEGLDIGTALLKVVMGEESRSDEELEEMAEASIRFLLSMVTMQSAKARNEEQLRGYVARRLLPALGFQIPEKFRIYGAKHG
jgi:AcrR family transcriptional regulator